MRAASIILAGFLLSACSAEDAVKACPADLRWTFGPRDTAVTVNSRFNMRLTLYGCAGTQVISDSSTAWASSDPSVATVDPQTGAVATLKLGTADISAKSYHSLVNEIAHIIVKN